ncbi:MAG: hypothetical protein ACK4I0_12820, partial [Brevundimonas sp.]|uniref:hypothetical protein n=1 Tax=Brevundimonas sp. TaxID=1871086 RepID=UPI00391D12AE
AEWLVRSDRRGTWQLNVPPCFQRALERTKRQFAVGLTAPPRRVVLSRFFLRKRNISIFKPITEIAMG